MISLKTSLSEIIVGKVENTGNQHYIFLPQDYLRSKRQFRQIKVNFNCCLQLLSM